MIIGKIAYITLLRRWRDRKELLTSIFLPLVLIVILGTALQGGFESSDLGNIPVGYYAEDEGYGRDALEAFLEDEEVKGWLNIIPLDSYEEGIKRVNELDLMGMIYLPSDFSENIHKGIVGEIEVIDVGISDMYSSIIRSVVGSFAQGGNLYFALTNYEETEESNTMAIMESNPENNTSRIESYTMHGENQGIRGIDYYAVTMLVMFVMWGIFTGAESLSEDLFTSMSYRIHGAPIGKWQYFIGKNLGILGTFVFQILSILFFTKFVYGVYWGDNILGVFGIAIVLSIVAISIGVTISMIAPSMEASSGIINGFVVIATFLAGGFFPINTDGGIMHYIKLLSPNYHAQRGIFHFVYGGESNVLIISLFGLGILFLVSTVIGIVYGRRRINDHI